MRPRLQAPWMPASALRCDMCNSMPPDKGLPGAPTLTCFCTTLLAVPSTSRSIWEQAGGGKASPMSWGCTWTAICNAQQPAFTGGWQAAAQLPVASLPSP